MPDRYVLAIDQGTTRTKSALFDAQGLLRGFGSAELTKPYPNPGWVELNPSAIWTSILAATRNAMRGANCRPSQIVAVGLDNQGETVVGWNKETGRPIYNAIVWQCRRTERTCQRLRAQKGVAKKVRS